MALHRPRGWKPSDGARFEIHFEKARRLHGEALEPIEAHLAADAPLADRWRWRPAHDETLERFLALLAEGLSVTRAAQALGQSRATAYRLHQRARQLGRLQEDTDD